MPTFNSPRPLPHGWAVITWIVGGYLLEWIIAIAVIYMLLMRFFFSPWLSRSPFVGALMQTAAIGCGIFVVGNVLYQSYRVLHLGVPFSALQFDIVLSVAIAAAIMLRLLCSTAATAAVTATVVGAGRRAGRWQGHGGGSKWLGLGAGVGLGAANASRQWMDDDPYSHLDASRRGSFDHANTAAPRHHDDSTDIHSTIMDEGINPATGLPMSGGIDLAGNPYGFDNSDFSNTGLDDWSSTSSFDDHNNWTNSFDDSFSDSSWNHDD